MYSRLARTSLSALAALLSLCTVAGTAHADAKSAAKCSGAIIKAGAGFVQAEAKILQKCRDLTLKGKTCDPAKTQASIDKARAKLRSAIVKACQGKDKSCDTVDADGTQPTLTEIGWNIGTCPNFEAGACTNTITDCDDIPTCIQCIGEASVNQAIELYYPNGRPASTGDKVLNKCQATIGKAALTFLAAKSKALSKCWGTKVKKTANCPGDAQAKISAARAKFATAIGKPCLGLDNSTIGLPNDCPAVTPEGAASCSGSVSSLIDVGNCASCVTEFKVDCPDRVSALSVGATYPPACQAAIPTPVATPTATPTVSATPTAVPVVCGDGIAAPSEPCDASAPAANWAQCGSDFTCTSCNCACPTTVTFAGDASDAATVLDTGWTGISHRAPAINNSEVTVSLSCVASSRPCGVCNITGPIANPDAGAGQIDNQRCTNDTSIRCTADTPCLSGGGTCQFFFGSALPLAAGGVTTCVFNQFNGPVTGTANVETGDSANVAKLTSRVYNGLQIDNPCARCIGDATINDGVQGGTCSGGTRDTLACDANGTVPGRPDFGSTSLDCPLAAGAIIATLPIDLTNATGPVTKTVSASSPGCNGAAGERCLCGTCNNGNAEPCQANADCPDPDGGGSYSAICNGNRCLGGTNAGAPCLNVSECPGGGQCNKPGEPTKPSACLDDTATPGVLDCNDTAPVDGEGECAKGPVTNTCSLASGHGQRGCTGDADCGGAVGSCESSNRRCFLTGGFTGDRVGTNTLVAEGVADTPMADVSNPTLGAVFCIGPTGAAAVNNVAGLPGPGRVTLKGQAIGHP